MSKVVAALDEEVAALREDMAKNPDPRQVKIDALLALKEQYSRTITGSLAVTLDDAKVVATGTVGAQVIGQIDPEVIAKAGNKPKSSETLRILQAVRDLLTIHARPLANKELVELLAGWNIKVRGTTPTNNLSAMLSNSKDFRSGGKAGWTLTGTRHDTSPTGPLAHLKAGATLKAAE